LAAAVLIEQQSGAEPILQVACRGRDLVELQSELLGAHALGVRNLVVLTGDPIASSERAAGRDESGDVDSIGLTQVVATRFNAGLDLAGQPMDEPTRWSVGVVANPTAVDLEGELRRLRSKLEAGASFVVTRPVFDLRAFDLFQREMRSAGVPLIATVWVFETLRRAELVANEMPGVVVPDAVVDRLRRCGSDASARAEGIAIARETCLALRERVQGLQIFAAVDDPALVLDAVRGLAAGTTPA
jgi:homocysteine S-methyltransferase